MNKTPESYYAALTIINVLFTVQLFLQISLIKIIYDVHYQHQFIPLS